MTKANYDYYNIKRKKLQVRFFAAPRQNRLFSGDWCRSGGDLLGCALVYASAAAI
jgi:hypothetical protein